MSMAGRGKHPVVHAPPAWLKPVYVRSIASRPVITIAADAPAREAGEIMRAEKIRHLPVLDAEGRLAGIVTDRDLRQVIFDPSIRERLGAAADALAGVLVREVMTWGAVTVHPDSDVRDAALLMHELKISALPVVDNGGVVGIVTAHDLVAALVDALRTHVTTARPIAAPPAGAEPEEWKP